MASLTLRIQDKKYRLFPHCRRDPKSPCQKVLDCFKTSGKV